jgi:uncharacterized protein DUF4157
MRWPFRRRVAEDGAVAPDRPQGSDRESVTRAPARQWATLPAIATTIPRAMPLVIGSAPVVPPLRLDDRNRAGGQGRAAPPVGSVTGLARPIVRPAETTAPAQPVEAAPLPMPRRAARPATAETPTLVDAVDQYVGEPRVPAEPHRAPGWLRFMPDWAKAGQSPAIPGLPANTPDLPDLPIAPAPPAAAPSPAPDLIVAEPPSFLPPELRNPAELPPRVAENVAPAAETLLPPARRRRPNLGQSRRLGLGAPLPQPELVHPVEPPPTVDGTVESPQEPPPPPAAPARVVSRPEPLPEPAPEPEPAPAGHDAGEPPAATPAPTAPTTSPAPPARPVAATYRATAELRPAPRRERPQATVVDRVPPALASEIRGRQQADVSEVPVYRGPKVSEAAKARGARAFAAGGAVFLPDEAGPADSPRARGLLAHELVHAVQQRALGTRLPAPDSPLGQHLEAEAQAAERFYSGESGAAEPPPLIHAPVPAPAPEPGPAPDPNLNAVAQLATQLISAPTTAPTPAPRPVDSPFDEQTAAEVDKIATESARHVVAEWTNPLLQQQNAPSGGAAPSGTGSAFSASARRQQLVVAALAAHNRNLSAGDTPLTTLPRDELNAIDRQVEAEATAHGVALHGALHGPATHGTSGHGSPSAHGGRGTPAGQGAQDSAQHYEAGSSAAWMHAVTGMNMNQGFGERGLSAPVGSAESWFGGRTNDDRPLRERMADQMGLINGGTADQFDSDTWWQSDEGQQGGDDAMGRSGAGRGGNHDRDSGSAMDDADLDELATRLYDRLRSRLRTELLVDRERAGLLTDFR